MTITDAMRPAYLPSTVLISENKDTAINFPALPGAVSVEGAGHGGGTIAAVPWLARAEHVIYWGDLDADGLEILDGFRAAGVRPLPIAAERVRSLTRPGQQAPPDPPASDGVSGQNSGVGALGVNPIPR